MVESKTVAMTAIAPHTFAGAAHAPGDTYNVAGDGSQSAEQYADTLVALQFAIRTPAKTGSGDTHGAYKTTDVGDTRTTELHGKPKK